MADPYKMWEQSLIGKHVKIYTDGGYAVFPCHGIKDEGHCTCGANPCGENNKNAGKHPYEVTAKNGCRSAVKDFEEAAELFQFRTDLNIAIATGPISDLLVMDIDARSNGFESIIKLEAVLGPLPPCPEVNTGGGGKHLFFNCPAEKVPTRNHAFGKDEYPGIDIKADGGYIVAPPSRHYSGAIYEFAEDFFKNDQVDFPETWATLGRSTHVKKNSQKKVVGSTCTSGATPEWSEDDVRDMLSFIHPDDDGYMAWVEIGFALQDAGYTYHVFDEWSSRGAKYVPGEPGGKWGGFKAGGGITMGTIVDRAMVRGWKPKSQHEPRLPTEQAERMCAPIIERILERKAIQEEPALKLVVNEPAKKKPEDIKKPLKESTYVPQFSFDPMELPGLIGDTVRWIAKYALYDQPELTLINTLAFAGAIFGRRYASPINTRTNIYLVGVARTGGGKDHSRQMIGSLAMHTGLSNYMGGNSIRSDTGMLRGLVSNSSQLLQIDEFGLFMQALSDPKAQPHHKAVSRVLMSLYSDAKGVYHHGDYADVKSQAIKIANPNLCIYGTTTEASYIPALKRAAIQSGELNRFIVVPSKRDSKPKRTVPVSEQDPELVAQWNQFAPGVNLRMGANCNSATVCPPPIIVEWGECEELQYQLHCEQSDMCSSKHPMRDLWSRFFENTIKIAMIFAIARNPEEPVFAVDDFNWAYSIVKCSIEYMASLAENSMAETPQEQHHNEVHKAIAEAGASGITRSSLLRMFRKLKKRETDELVGTMMEEGIVLADRVVTGDGRPATVYFAVKHISAAE